MRSGLCLALVLASVVPIAPAAEEDAPRYREYVRQCVETLIEHGTDRYGPVQSPVRMHELTGDAQHRDFAHEAAREAVARLFHQGLFRGHPAKPYYESLDGVGDLLCALLELDASAQ